MNVPRPGKAGPYVVAVAVVVSLLATSAVWAQTPLLVDPAVTVGAGASIFVNAADAIARGEGRIVPDRVLEERGGARRTTNIAYRFFRLTLFDLPQEHFFMVANHEVFGHGGRLRERFDGPISYGLDAPPPYGDGGGVTSFQFDREPSVHEVLAVSAAGMEANTVAADAIAFDGVARRSISARTGMRYLEARLDATSYILGTGDEPEEPGHDVSDFIDTYNLLADAASTAPLSARTLRHEVLVTFADPMLAYSAFAIGRFVATGATMTRVPMLRVASWRVLPALRYRLTPFGTEWGVATDISTDRRTMHVEVRSGRSPGASPWGVSARQIGVATVRRWRIAVDGDIWRQPPLALDADALLELDPRWGGEIRARLSRPVVTMWGRATDFVVETGVKSNGFVAGEPLDGGMMLRAGVGLPFGRVR